MNYSKEKGQPLEKEYAMKYKTCWIKRDFWILKGHFSSWAALTFFWQHRNVLSIFYYCSKGQLWYWTDFAKMKSLDCYRNKALSWKTDIIADVEKETPTLEDMNDMEWFISIFPEKYATDHNNSALQMQKQLAESLTEPFLSVSPIFHHGYWLHTFISYSKVFICWSKNATSILFCLHFFTFCPSCFKAILPEGNKQPRGFVQPLWSFSECDGSLSCGLHLWTPLK